jgi:hypothetical protein
MEPFGRCPCDFESELEEADVGGLGVVLDEENIEEKGDLVGVEVGSGL